MPEEPRWHPVLATRESPTGTWTLVAPDSREYGRVQILRRGPAAEASLPAQVGPAAQQVVYGA
ncbi:hypothetical protein [Schumannella sp. 10F1B-5-1]|uniref:hypothetical protein n=1 Tax=Schumannella sp. 10F1B-5-1 TaxID=2590780 RepID=UPI0011322481|nr:hypothetical protein [Schumannella sp. 10F1B-5-1]